MVMRKYIKFYVSRITGYKIILNNYDEHMAMEPHCYHIAAECD